MLTAEALKRKIQSADDLLGVVKTMKALAAVSIRQYQRAVESLNDYNATVEAALQIVLMRGRGRVEAVSKQRRLGVLVFGTDQGLCGQFNQIVGLWALKEIGLSGFPPERRIVFAVGRRVADILEDGGQEVAEVLDTPGSTAGITSMVQDITFVLEEWRFRHTVEEMCLYYNEYISGATYHPRTMRLLPLDRQWLESLRKRPWDSKTIPTFTMDWERIFRTLVREYLFVSIYRAFAHSLASENASRLAAMQNAEKNIEERLEELGVQFHRQRQMTITEELLDIVAGFEAMKEERAAPAGRRRKRQVPAGERG
ncbi:MAG TPA: F0F1 ATP synthase subunit gamma [Syntrophales bacterium]|nr:F0F1 ATP synthase subunit gamma [Syntrophales bacterium]HOM07826.1 F0F1 ATP synthase subunit gamma [Syntrophales bacterium]HOO00540.1 F0F1 ATP synthase subunit gamma [Syntrophales bacterium]HPC01854.1 F0F1 ATP synthase subunit gamma [Syntrophales bacterium]HPQ07350.1 F0F1 ATP synthase subunit gamma [Syntrophales bacterium]